MADNKGSGKTQGVVTKPNASSTNPAKPVTGTGGTQPNVAQPKPPQAPPPAPQPNPAAQPPNPQQPPAPQQPNPQQPNPQQPNPNPQAPAGQVLGRDPRVLPIPINTPAVAGTFIDRTLNDAVRKVFRGNVNERSATEIFEKLNQIAPLSTVAGRTGPQSEHSTSSSAGTSTAGQSVAQMSLVERAHAALADAEKRLGALKPMQTPSDPENLDALRAITLATYKRLVNEFGRSGSPRVDRVEKHLTVLIGDPAAAALAPRSLLGKIQDQFKLQSAINSPEDSANVANFRIVKDNLFDVHRSWEAFIEDRQEDFGEQAARFSRFLVMIEDDVTDVETALDEVNFDATDRDSLEINGPLTITIEGLLSWIAEFATEEGPEMVDEGGALGIAATLPTLVAIHGLVENLIGLNEVHVKDPNVQATLNALLTHLTDAKEVAQTIDQRINPAQP